MPRQANRVSGIVYDEVSFVDLPAAADARIAIAKRQEDTVADYFDAEGNEVDPSTLDEGDIVFDAEGDMYEYSLRDDDDTEVVETTKEPVGVSKAFTGAKTATVSKSLGDTIREELAKAATSEQREEIYKRALADADSKAGQALEIAKREENLRLDREYTEIAKAYNVPEKPETLGPILKRMAESMSEEDCTVIHKLLTGVGEILTTELGFSGTGEPADPYEKLDAVLDQRVSKAAGKVSKAQATEDYFDADPREYDAYLATRTR